MNHFSWSGLSLLAIVFALIALETYADYPIVACVAMGASLAFANADGLRNGRAE